MSHVLILGGTGRLAQLLRHAWGPRPPLPVLWQTRRRTPGPHWIELDPLASPDALAEAASHARVILDLTGVTAGDATALAHNTALAAASRAAAAGSGAWLFLPSSAAVYGATEGPADESRALAPLSAYGRAKRQMEAEAAGQPQVTCLRICNVAGADALLGDGTREEIALDTFPDATSPRRSYFGPEGFAAALATLLHQAWRGADLPAVLNLAPPESLEMAELLEAAGCRWTPRPAGPNAVRETTLAADQLAARHRFGGGEGTAAQVACEWRRLL